MAFIYELFILQQKRFTIKLVKKKEEKGFIIYDLALSAHLDLDVTLGKVTSKENGSVDTGAGDDDSKPRHASLFQFIFSNFSFTSNSSGDFLLFRSTGYITKRKSDFRYARNSDP